MEGEVVKNYETTRMSKDGTLIEVSVTVSPIRDPTGKIIAASTIVHDITEQKRMIEELITLNAALVEANKTRDQFLATMSHELRTPLTSIIGFSEMQLDDITQADMNSALLDNQRRILKNAQHLLCLINDVLDLSKIQAGRMDITFIQVNVRKLLTSVVEETQSIALAQNITLGVEVEERLDLLETNELKLHQILLNLVSNALKFAKNGEVTLSARRVESSHTEGEHIAIAVADTGIGIPEDLQERVFEAFFQADGSHTRKIGGTGLGLAIVMQLTTLLGGTVQVKSSLGQGSTFTVFLPLKATQLQVEQPFPRLYPPQLFEVPTTTPNSADFEPALLLESLTASANPEANDGQINLVLAVDDNPDVIDLIKAAFKNTPYKIVGVTDPSKVMPSIQKLRPCAITLDVMMPKLNGWQILHRLKNNPVVASIPIIVLSVLSEPTTGYVLGADDYLIKPFNRDTLVSTLHRLVASRQSSFQATSQA